MRNLAIVGTVAAAAIGLSFAGQAKADILPSVDSPVVTASGTGTFIYSYNVFVTSTQEIRTGNFFRFNDFNGFVSVVSSPANWTPTVSATDGNVTIPGIGTVMPVDTASPNITFTYNGAATILGGPTSLGTFSLESLYGPGTLAPFIGNGTDQRTGIPNANITNYVAPVPEPGEYAVMGLFGVGLVGLMARARRKAARTGDLAAA